MVRTAGLTLLLAGLVSCARRGAPISQADGAAVNAAVDAIAVDAAEAAPIDDADARDGGDDATPLVASGPGTAENAEATRLGTLIEILIAEGDPKEGPRIRTALWCETGWASRKQFAWNNTVSNLPAISADAASIAVLETDQWCCSSHHGASLVLLDREGTITRRIRLWTTSESEYLSSMSPSACRALQPVLHQRFADAQLALRATKWRPLTSLPATFRVVPKYDYLDSIPTDDGGVVTRPGPMTRLKWISVFDDARVDLDPQRWLAERVEKGLCTSPAWSVGTWYDPATKLVLLQLDPACHLPTVDDGPRRFFPAFPPQ